MPQPHEAAVIYFLDSLKGGNLTYQYVRDHSGPHARPMTRPDDGSWNMGPLFAAGAAIQRESGGQELGPFLRGENGMGLCATELGSTIYNAWTWSAVLGLYNAADRSATAASLHDAAGRWLRAMTAFWVLGMTRRRPRRIVLEVGRQPPQEFSPRYKAPYCVSAGNRQVSKHSTGSVANNMMPVLLAAALGLERAFPREKIHEDPKDWSWTVRALELATRHRFSQSIPASCFALTDEDRAVFHHFLSGRQSPESLLPYLEGYTTSRQQVIHWVQRLDGTVVSWENFDIHGSTSGCTFTEHDVRQGLARWVCPQSGVRNAGKSHCRRDGSTFICEARHRDGTEVIERFEGYDPSTDLWTVVMDVGGARLERSELSIPPGPREETVWRHSWAISKLLQRQPFDQEMVRRHARRIVVLSSIARPPQADGWPMPRRAAAIHRLVEEGQASGVFDDLHASRHARWILGPESPDSA